MARKVCLTSHIGTVEKRLTRISVSIPLLVLVVVNTVIYLILSGEIANLNHCGFYTRKEYAASQ